MYLTAKLDAISLFNTKQNH